MSALDAAFRKAVINNNMRVLKKILSKRDKNIDIDQLFRRGRTAVHVAVGHDNPDMARLLFSNGARTDYRYNNGFGYLHMTADSGNAIWVQFFLEYIDVDDVSIETHNASLQYTPLVLALMRDHYEVAQCLLDKGANVNFSSPSDGRNILHVAVERKNRPLIEWLLRKGADPNQKNTAGSPPVIEFFSQFPDDIELFRLFLEHGARIGPADEMGYLAISSAIRFSSCEIFQEMLQLDFAEYGDVLVGDVIASNRFKPESVVLEKLHLLVPFYNINVEQLIYSNVVVLRDLVMSKRVETIKYLCDLGADLNISITYPYIPIIDAISMNDDEMVEVLLRYGTRLDDVNDYAASRVIPSEWFTDNPKRWPLMNLVSSVLLQIMLYETIIDNRNLTTMKHLLMCGANVNNSFSGINLPLEFALFNTWTEGVEPVLPNDDLDVIFTLVQHITLLQDCGRPVDEKNLKIINSSGRLLEIRDETNECIRLMKSTKFCPDYAVTYYDLLMKRRNALVNCLRISEVARLVLANENNWPVFCDERFEIFRDQIEFNVTVGMDILRKMNRFRDVLSELFGSILPDVVIDHIVEYFDDKTHFKMLK